MCFEKSYLPAITSRHVSRQRSCRSYDTVVYWMLLTWMLLTCCSVTEKSVYKATLRLFVLQISPDNEMQSRIMHDQNVTRQSIFSNGKWCHSSIAAWIELWHADSRRRQYLHLQNGCFIHLVTYDSDERISIYIGLYIDISKQWQSCCAEGHLTQFVIRPLCNNCQSVVWKKKKTF